MSGADAAVVRTVLAPVRVLAGDQLGSDLGNPRLVSLLLFDQVAPAPRTYQKQRSAFGMQVTVPQAPSWFLRKELELAAVSAVVAAASVVAVRVEDLEDLEDLAVTRRSDVRGRAYQAVACYVCSLRHHLDDSAFSVLAPCQA